MALVITLIMLSVTLVMAVAFLAISRRERNAVTTTTDTATARLAADAALAGAEAQIVANLFASTNAAAYNFGLLVSTNYINGYGFNPAGGANPTNVNFDYTYNGAAFKADDLNQDFANLFFLPRVPVYMTNLVFHTNENRFYLDLNRNGRFEDTRTNVPNVDYLGVTNGTIPEVGDPQWVGVLDHPDAPHGPNNRFVSRYAFIAVPVGNTLDLNAIHNQVLNEPSAPSSIPITINPPANGDGYFRNQGVGSWEINLAAFLADLNTNQWGETIDPPNVQPSAPTYYQYNEPKNYNHGYAFDDARALLAYRYANDYNSLASVDSLYGVAGLGHFAFLYDNIDGYSDGPLMTTLNTNEFSSPDRPQLPWAGADNTNQFFTPEELFDTNKTGIGAAVPRFTDRLLAAGTNTFGGTTVPTYDRYTFYRMLDELGSDSVPDSGKINLNYSNAVVQTDRNGSITNIAVMPGAETNFVPWTTTNFFLAAADRMLRLYSSNWFQGSSFDYYTNYTAVTNWIYVDQSNYLATYYGIYTNYFSYVDAQGRYIWNAPNGLGLTNVPFYGMTNQVPAFGITNIPVWVNNQFVYTPAVNRLLQLAANIYDATTNNSINGSPDYPHVFRPLFSRDANSAGIRGMGTNLFVSGYAEVTSVNVVNGVVNDLQLSLPVNASALATTNVAVHNMPVNVYGVPWIIGAKKGFPNFNEFYMESAFRLTRKLMVTRQSTNMSTPAPPPSSPFWGYYVMYNLSLSNHFGVECWNSYHSNYTRPLTIYITDDLTMILTNDEVMGEGGQLFNNGFSNHLFTSVSVTTNSWQGYIPGSQFAPLSFLTNFPDPSGLGIIPTNFAAIPDSRYMFNGNSPYLTTNLDLWYETTGTGFGTYPEPHWWLTMANNLRLIMVDTSDPNNGKVIDYVQLAGPNSLRDLTAEIQRGYDTSPTTNYNDLWDTNQISPTSAPNGIANQYAISQGNGNPTWTQTLWGDQKMAYDAMNAFRAFTIGPDSEITYDGYVPDQNLIGAALMTNAMQMPYMPTALVVQDIVWQANDPLVHYLASDLTDPTAGQGLRVYLNWPGNLGQLNQRYRPWGATGDTNAYTLAIKDPLIYSSDDWNFPTNRFPTVGWLGRVHRGTPWQTVYLKASDVLSFTNMFGNYGTNLWIDRTGNVNPFDAANTAPKKDWLLFDVFTTAFNDNATRGQLSVNVAADKLDPMAGLAAWSALFSGVMVLYNNASDNTLLQPTFRQGANSITTYTDYPISPAGPGTNSALWQLVQGIYNTRTNFTNPDGVKGAFEHVGYILSVPQLTQYSPFLNAITNGVGDGVQQQYGISDEMYEWLPQQVMSLLRAGPPRYVIYCYGQALKPAPNSLVTGGTYFGMCTNYQVVAESAARAVVRVDGAGTSAPRVVVESFNPLPPD
jgi:hypothetical protein